MMLIRFCLTSKISFIRLPDLNINKEGNVMKQILRIFVIVIILLSVSFSSRANSKTLIKLVARDSMGILKALAVNDSSLPKLINHTVQEHCFFPGLVGYTIGAKRLLTANGKLPFTELSIPSNNIGMHFIGLELGFSFEFILTNGNGELKIKDLAEYIRDGITSVVLSGESFENSLNIVPAAYLVVLNALLRVPGWLTTQLEKTDEELLEAFVVYTKLIELSLNPGGYGEDVRGLVAYAQGEIGERIEEDAFILNTKIKYADHVKQMVDALVEPLFRIYNSMDDATRTQNEGLFAQAVLAVLGIIDNSNLILANEFAIIEARPLKWLSESAQSHNIGSIMSGSIVKHMKF